MQQHGRYNMVIPEQHTPIVTERRQDAPAELAFYLGVDAGGRTWCGDRVFPQRCREGGEGCEGWRVTESRLSRLSSFFPMMGGAVGASPEFLSEAITVTEVLPFSAADTHRTALWRDCDVAETVERESEDKGLECLWTSDNLSFRTWFTIDVAVKAAVGIAILWLRNIT